MLRGWLSWLLGFSFLLGACALEANPPEPSASPTTHVRLPMGYIPNVQYSPLYLAMDRGYFQEAGIEVEFDYSFETDGVTLLGANELKFSLASGEQVLLARAKGLPIVYVLGWWQGYPVAVAAPADSGIREPADLEGKRVGIPILGGASYIGYRALLSAAGLPEDLARLDVIGFTQVEALLARRIDAAVVYANNEPIQYESKGLPVNVMRVADYVRLASNGLITNETTLKEQPDLVRAMVWAMIRGIQDAIDDPDAAFEVSRKYVEGLEGETATIQRQVLEASLEFWKAERIGYSDPEAWNGMQRVLLEMGLIQTPLDLSQAYTNAFLP